MVVTHKIFLVKFDFLFFVFVFVLFFMKKLHYYDVYTDRKVGWLKNVC